MRRTVLQRLDGFAIEARICTRCSQRCLTTTARRHAQIQAVGSHQPPDNQLNTSPISNEQASPDAQFEVLGHPYSLLSAKLSPSQNLFVRRGSLVGVSGRPNDTVSTLSVIGPLRRAPFGIPFLYQRVSATSPITAHISTKHSASSFSVIHLDGRTDWIVAQRNGLLAWTGHTLTVSPRTNLKFSLAHWGNTYLTGRGLVALVGKGQVFQVALRAGEEYIAHPGNVLAYTVNANPPLPYRFASSSLLRLQIPGVAGWIPENRFTQTVRASGAWRFVSRALFVLRTWLRRTVWGDRLFMQFRGPGTVLLQSRGGNVVEALTDRDVNEIADAPAGAVRDAVVLDVEVERRRAEGAVVALGSASASTAPQVTGAVSAQAPTPSKMRVATVRSGKVDFRDA